MSIVNTTVSALTDGTYGLPNSIVGQIKAVLANDANVDVISDNDPANDTMRVLVYSVASQSHYTKIATTGGTAVSFSTLKLDGATAIATAYAATVASGTGYSVRLLYNAKVHALVYNNIISAGTYYLDVGDSANGWYTKPMGANQMTVAYFNSSDTAGALKYPSFGAVDASGRFVGVAIRFTIGTALSNYYNPYFYGTGTEIVASGAGFYTAGEYNYLIVSSSCAISDQVPA